ncbi:MAG: chemotaxis protein CheA [Nitrospinae bacterium]|nr:chemotaxis protein CheA [Nitrospinota bacterium]
MAIDSVKLLEKLESLSLQMAMADSTLTDLKTVVELSQSAEEIKGMVAGEKPEELALLFAGLASALEQFMMGGAPADSAATAMELLSEAVNLARDAMDARFDIVKLKPRAEKVLETLKTVFSVVPAPPPAAKKEEQAPSAESSKPTPAPAKATGSHGGEVKGSSLTLIDENDIVIFEGFVDESTDMVNKIEEYVMALEENPNNADIISSLFRVFHSLKGAAGFLGMNEINTLCHDAENLLDNIRKGKMKVDRECSDIIMAVRDTLEKGLAAISETLGVGKANLPNFTSEIKKLTIEPILELIDRKLFGASGDEGAPKLGDILVEKRIVTADQLQEALEKREKPLGEILVEMGATSKANIDSALKEQQSKKAAPVAAIKVDTKKLNTLLELVGELVIAQAIISQSSSLDMEENQKLSKDIGEMAKITNGIQDHIMSLRMVPMHGTFQKMNRLVRDLSRKTGKQVNFAMQGEETEIDKTIVEQLNDPLVHLLRNAVDHGVEAAEDRMAQGKEPEGTVTLAAYHKGGSVIIEVKDDGKGLNLEKIKNLAFERGILDKNGTYTEDEIRDVIFLPGFSTHKVATDLSGRGVGMDVVRRNVESLGGKVLLFSTPGQGSTFQIKLPLTMAIVDGMLVRVGDERYIIPTISISESIKPKPEQLSTVVEKGEVMNVRGELIPLVRLHELFGVEGSRKEVVDGLVIIVGTEKEHRGLMVDDLLGQQQVVIKNLDRRFTGMKGFSGSSILGDGLVGLILDVGGVFDLASN